MSRLFDRSYRPERAFIPTTGCQANFLKGKSACCGEVREIEADRADVGQVDASSLVQNVGPAR
jgi:hypothetical protein